MRSSISSLDRSAFRRQVGRVNSVTGSSSNVGDSLPYDDAIMMSPLNATSSRHRRRANSLNNHQSSSPASPDTWTSSSTIQAKSVSSSSWSRFRRPLIADHNIVSTQWSPTSLHHVIMSSKANGRNVAARGHVISTTSETHSSDGGDQQQGVHCSTKGATVNWSMFDSEAPHNGELERRLAEREDELLNLRQTMERNELAIMQVVEDQRRQLVRERTKEFDSSFLKAMKESERLKRENKYLKATLKATRERLENNTGATREPLENNTGETRERLEMPEIYTKSSPPMKLPRKIPEAVAVASSLTRSISLSTLQDTCSDVLFDAPQLAECLESNEDANKTQWFPAMYDKADHHLTEALRTGNGSSVPNDCGDVCRRCFAMNIEIIKQRKQFDRERTQWLYEKRLVIEYQKLLQIGLLRFASRCKLLETQLLPADTCVDDESGLSLDAFADFGSLRESTC